MKLTVHAPGLGINTPVKTRTQLINTAIDPLDKFSPGLVGIRSELLSGRVQIRAKLGKGGIRVGSEVDESRLDSAQALIHLLMRHDC